MYRGTTPTFLFKLNTSIDFAAIKQAWLTLKTDTKEITYDKDDLSFNNEEKSIRIKLSQEDTLLFRNDIMFVQLRLLLDNDEAYASSIKQISVSDILKDGVIE